MKRFKHNIYLIHAFVTLALIGNLSACVEYQGPDSGYGTNGKLSVKGTVSEATIITRADGTTPSVVALKEKELNTLDVFVEHVTGTTGDGEFMVQYHLTSNIVEASDWAENTLYNKLSDSWVRDGFKVGEKYNIYVATNNTQTKDEKNLSTFNVEALKALVADEVTDEVAVIEDGNIGSKGNNTSGNIYKLYDANPGSARALTSEKDFMMAGVIENWSPDQTKMDQVFNVTLDRAAAKFVVNVKFDATFLQSLSADGVSITGSPAWKFYNFAFGAPVFAPATQGDGVEVHNSGFNIFHNQSCADGQSFTITTYSYPNKWDEVNYSTKAPSLIISIMYSDSEAPHYYRIPLVASTVTSIERNHIYVIDATIATRGSDIHEDVTLTENIQYAVLPWNDKNNTVPQQTAVLPAQHYYLKVNPKIYTLRGDGEQSVDINYLKATGTQVKWKLYSFDTDTEEKGSAVEPTANNAVWGWYYNGDGSMKTSYTGLTHMGVTITQREVGDGREATKGTVTVKSTALANRAIKYMLLRIYLYDSPTLYEDVIIRHFPTDNIQSIPGLWSSRTTANWWDASSLTGSWWNTTNPQGYGIGYDGLFRARYYYNNNYMRGAQNEYASTYHNWTSYTDLTNNNKYVIQISSTSNQYVLGRPILNGNNQSNDHVVSPAFIIASQLGATTSTQPRNNQIPNYAREAALHCQTYKEVDMDKTEWTGWRLPTREEVGVIIRYQHARYDTMDPVLTGRYYWTLEGAAVATGINNEGSMTWYSNWATRYSDDAYDYQYGDGRCYIRCIRDMSASEIIELNNFDSIVNKYREGSSN